MFYVFVCMYKCAERKYSLLIKIPTKNTMKMDATFEYLWYANFYMWWFVFSFMTLICAEIVLHIIKDRTGTEFEWWINFIILCIYMNWFFLVLLHIYLSLFFLGLYVYKFYHLHVFLRVLFVFHCRISRIIILLYAYLND